MRFPAKRPAASTNGPAGLQPSDYREPRTDVGLLAGEGQQRERFWGDAAPWLGCGQKGVNKRCITFK